MIDAMRAANRSAERSMTFGQRPRSAMRVHVEGYGHLDFHRALDGWWEHRISRGHGLSIDPDLKVCRRDPWYADYISDAPSFKFIIEHAPRWLSD